MLHFYLLDVMIAWRQFFKVLKAVCPIPTIFLWIRILKLPESEFQKNNLVFNPKNTKIGEKNWSWSGSGSDTMPWNSLF